MSENYFSGAEQVAPEPSPIDPSVEPAANNAVPSELHPAAAEETPNRPRRIKRNLKARDVKRFGQIVGKIQKMTRQAVLEGGGQMLDNQQLISLILTDGLEYAEEELNLWFADLCKISWRETGVDASASEQEKKQAIVEYIADGEIEFYSDVLEDLVDFGGLNGFLTGLTRLWGSINSVFQISTPSGSTTSSQATGGQTNT